MIWQKYGYVVASTYRTKVVKALSSHPRTPKQISIETKMGLSHVSRTLKELVLQELVCCVNPFEVKGRVYKLTEKGKKVAKLIQEE